MEATFPAADAEIAALRKRYPSSVVGQAGIGLDGHFVQWDPTFIRKLLISLVRKKIGLFAIYPEIGKEDLLQVAEMAIRSAWPKWNPRRAALSTYLYKAGQNAVISLWRTAEVKHRGESSGSMPEDAAATPTPSLESIAVTLAAIEWQPEDSVRDWLKRLHDAVKKHPDTRRRTRYTLAQAISIAFLMKKMKLGYKGVRHLLEQQEDFREAIQLQRVPSHGQIQAIAREFLN